MSSDSSANDVLAGYLAGRVTAELLVAAVSAEYYRETGNGKRETLRPIMDVIERTHPGVVELSSTADRPGFGVRLAGRPFPKRSEPELRAAVQQVLDTLPEVINQLPEVKDPLPEVKDPLPASRFPFPGEVGRPPTILQRIIAVIRRVFS